jgi:chromosome segregation ATPase
MKLTQGSSRPPAAPAEPEDGTLNGRLDAVEQRLARVEQTPAVVPGPALPPFSQKVLEAVVEALEKRLRDQSTQWEKRMAELEARMSSENRALEKQDRTIIAACQERIGDVQAQWSEKIEGLRRQLAEQDRALESRIEATRRELVELLSQAAEKQAAGAGAVVEKKLSALVEAKGREVNDLRHQLSETEHRVSDALDSIGRILREAAGRKDIGVERRRAIRPWMNWPGGDVSKEA